MYVSVDIDPDEILSDLTLTYLIRYLKENYKIDDILEKLNEYPEEADLSIKGMENAYWHGDLDLKALLNKLGPEETQKILQEN